MNKLYSDNHSDYKKLTKQFRKTNIGRMYLILGMLIIVAFGSLMCLDYVSIDANINAGLKEATNNSLLVLIILMAFLLFCIFIYTMSYFNVLLDYSKNETNKKEK